MSENKAGLLKKTVQLIIVALFAKGLGFVREMVLAYYYGTSMVSDVFVAVQNIPSIIFTIFGVAITTEFIPIYSGIRMKDGTEQADRFANNIFNIFFVLSVVLTLLGTVFSKPLVKLFAGGFTGETLALCNAFAKIIMPSSIAIILVYVYNAYLQIYGFFLQNSMMNIPYNLLQMLGIVLGFYLNNYYILAIGILVSSFAQLLYLRILIRTKTAFKHRFVFNFKDPGLMQMLVLVGPVFISTGISQINNIIDRSLASRLQEGSVSALNYSSEVTSIVIQVVIMSLTMILYPKMIECFARDDAEKRNSFVKDYLGTVALLALPLSALIFMLSEDVLSVLFERGAFTHDTVLFVNGTLKMYAIGIIGASLRDALNRAFYALKDTKTPMINGVIAVLCNIALNFLLIRKYQHIGLAFATSASALLCTLLLFIQLIRRFKGFHVATLLIGLSKMAIGVVLMVLSLWASMKWIPLTNAWLRCLVFGIIGLAVYILVLFLLKEKTFLSFVGRKKKVAVPEADSETLSQSEDFTEER